MSTGVTLWFTGLSGSGKTTIAQRVHELLQARNILSERLDGDVVRQSLCRDLGFSKEDRDKNIERVTFVAKVLTRNGVVVLSCFVSPYRAMRDKARHEIGEFLEVYVRTPLEVLVARDVKGMYRKAMAGEIQGFTGVNDPYEEPVNPELILDTDKESIDESAARVLQLLEARGYIDGGGPGSAVDRARAVEASKRSPGPVAPHGGTLVDRELKGAARQEALERAKALPKFGLDEREMSDLEMIGYGALSPLTGYMRQADYETVLDSMRLTDGLPWALPVNLATSSERAKEIAIGQEIALTEKGGKILAVMTVTDLWRPDKSREVLACFGTEDRSHPGVQRVLTQGDVYLGGPVWVISRPTGDPQASRRLTPLETRQAFDAHGWTQVAGFPLGSPVHRAHEYRAKVALEVVDGVWMHQIVGASAPGDMSADVRLKTGEVVVEGYFPPGRVHLSMVPGVTRFAGARDALWHAIASRNYGCTHVILGPGGSGDGSDNASDDMDVFPARFPLAEVGVTLLRFGHVWWCTRTGAMASTRTSPAGPSERVTLSDAQVREMLLAGELLPGEFTRSEVAHLLHQAYRMSAASIGAP